MNCFKYDFDHSIKFSESCVKEDLDFLSSSDDVSKNVIRYRNCLDFLMANILRKVQCNQLDFYDSLLRDASCFFDVLDEVIELDLVSSLRQLFKSKISSERISSVLFLLSVVVSRDSFIRFISDSEFSSCKYLSFLTSIWCRNKVLPSFDSPAFKMLDSISSSNSNEILNDFLDKWPLLLKNESISYCNHRYSLVSSKGDWTGDDCYVVMLLSFLFAADQNLDADEEYLPTNLMPLFKESFPIYGLLRDLTESDKVSKNSIPRGFNPIDSQRCIGDKDFSFLFDAIFGYAPVDYSTNILSGLSDSKSSNVLQFLGDVNTLEYDSDIYETLGFTYLILVDRKDNEELIYQLSNITENVFGQGFEFDFLACTDTMSTIQSFNSALSQHGSYLYLLDLQADNLVLFVTKKEFVGKLDEIFSSL